MQLLKGKSTLIGDCQPVVQAARSSQMQALHHSKIHAGARLLAIMSGNSGLVESDRWVKAHREVSAALDEADKRDILGNCAADRGAVDAQSLHWWPSGDFHKVIAHEHQQLFKIIKVLVSTVILWPSHSQAANKEESASRATPPKRRIQPAKRPHLWQFRGHAWYCSRCLSVARNSATKAHRAGEECPGCSVKMITVLAAPQGHSLIGAEDEAGAPVIACVRCGSWATRHPRNLAQPCPKFCRPQSSAHYALVRMACGKHPDYETNRTICKPVALVEEHQQDAAETLDAFLASRKDTNRPVRKYGNGRLEALRQRVLSRVQATNVAHLV